MSRSANTLIQRSTCAGFVLVGVVMFVLALTILAISLFSLSSYEAQFYGESSNSLQAFYSATGGLERARFVLATQKTLQSVTNSLAQPGGLEGVTYARARYTDGAQESTGTIDFSSSRLIAIRVLGVCNGQKRMVQALFQPKTVLDYYKRLVTTSDAMTGLSFGGFLQNQARAFLIGDAMQNSTDTTSWATAGARPRFLPHNDPIPVPALNTFFADHFNDPATQDVALPPDGKYLLQGTPGGGPTFFRTRSAPPSPYSLWDIANTSPEIDVKGTVVWMLDRGARFDFGVTVNGQPSDCLIIVARDGLFLGEHAGVYTFAGLTSDKVPVIIVTDSYFRDEQFVNNPSGTTNVNYLSAFASQVSIVGPTLGGSMTLTHDPNSPNDSSGGLIDRLYGEGALPNPSPGASLTQVSGHWAELDPDNPPQPN